MPDCDLPKNLQGKKHDDWIWPLSLIPRGWNAFGPRCSHWREVPVLWVGYNTTRWMTPGDTRIADWRLPQRLQILTGYSFKKQCWLYNFGHLKVKNNEMGPSPLQKFSKWGFSLVWPLHFEFHYQFTAKKVLLFRIGCRWDSYDSYYNIGPYIGLAWN